MSFFPRAATTSTAEHLHCFPDSIEWPSQRRAPSSQVQIFCAPNLCSLFISLTSCVIQLSSSSFSHGSGWASFTLLPNLSPHEKRNERCPSFGFVFFGFLVIGTIELLVECCQGPRSRSRSKPIVCTRPWYQACSQYC